MSVTREEALEYHRLGRPGKIEVTATKPLASQRDLALAYTPGVAQPVLEIEQDARTAYEYTAKGNLVAVVSNGTAVLGFPFIFRGALDVRARAINDEMKVTAARSLAELAKQDVPDIVHMAAVSAMDAQSRTSPGA